MTEDMILRMVVGDAEGMEPGTVLLSEFLKDVPLLGDDEKAFMLEELKAGRPFMCDVGDVTFEVRWPVAELADRFREAWLGLMQVPLDADDKAHGKLLEAALFQLVVVPKGEKI